MKKLLSIGLVVGLMSSCTVSHTFMVTNNSVGSKTGVAKGKDISISTACKNGGISKVGTVETKMKMIIIFPKMTTTVTGE